MCVEHGKKGKEWERGIVWKLALFISGLKNEEIYIKSVQFFSEFGARGNKRLSLFLDIMLTLYLRFHVLCSLSETPANNNSHFLVQAIQGKKLHDFSCRLGIFIEIWIIFFHFYIFIYLFWFNQLLSVLINYFNLFL